MLTTTSMDSLLSQCMDTWLCRAPLWVSDALLDVASTVLGYPVRNCILSRFGHVKLCVILLTVARQAPLSMGFSKTRILEWVAMPSSRGSSRPRDQTFSVPCVFCIAGRSLGSHSRSPPCPSMYLNWPSAFFQKWFVATAEEITEMNFFFFASRKVGTEKAYEGRRQLRTGIQEKIKHNSKKKYCRQVLFDSPFWWRDWSSHKGRRTVLLKLSYSKQHKDPAFFLHGLHTGNVVCCDDSWIEQGKLSPADELNSRLQFHYENWTGRSESKACEISNH